MRYVISLVLFSLACTKPAPATPKAQPDNLACTAARSLDKDAGCIPLRSGAVGMPDTAIVEVGGGVLARCTAGVGCTAFADLRPRAPEGKPQTPTPEPAAVNPGPAVNPPTPAPAAPSKAPKK